MLTLLWVIIIGGLVGYLASIITKTEERYGVIGNIFIGIVGSFLAGVVSALAVGRDVAELGSFTWESVLWSLLGAIGLILIINALSENSRR